MSMKILSCQLQTRYIHPKKQENHKTTYKNSTVDLNNIPHYTQNFTSLLNIDDFSRQPISTSFYHDIQALSESTNRINNPTFPEGIILDYGCANGEETLSLYSMIDSHQKHTVIGIDPSIKALEQTQIGKYCITNACDDKFLLAKSVDDIENPLLKDAYIRFHSLLNEIPPESFPREIETGFEARRTSNNFVEKFYEVKPEIQKNLTYLHGKIEDIDKLQIDKPVNAIFFRNGLYQCTSNNLPWALMYNEKFSSGIDRTKILENIIRKIHDKLEQGGLLVLGEHIQEHIYIADKSIPEENIKYVYHVPVMNYNPLNKILLANNFEPLNFKKIYALGGLLNTNITTLWRKVK